MIIKKLKDNSKISYNSNEFDLKIDTLFSMLVTIDGAGIIKIEISDKQRSKTNIYRYKNVCQEQRAIDESIRLVVLLSTRDFEFLGVILIKIVC